MTTTNMTRPAKEEATKTTASCSPSHIHIIQNNDEEDASCPSSFVFAKKGHGITVQQQVTDEGEGVTVITNDDDGDTEPITDSSEEGGVAGGATTPHSSSSSDDIVVVSPGTSPSLSFDLEGDDNNEGEGDHLKAADDGSTTKRDKTRRRRSRRRRTRDIGDVSPDIPKSIITTTTSSCQPQQQQLACMQLGGVVVEQEKDEEDDDQHDDGVARFDPLLISAQSSLTEEEDSSSSLSPLVSEHGSCTCSEYGQQDLSWKGVVGNIESRSTSTASSSSQDDDDDGITTCSSDGSSSDDDDDDSSSSSSWSSSSASTTTCASMLSSYSSSRGTLLSYSHDNNENDVDNNCNVDVNSSFLGGKSATTTTTSPDRSVSKERFQLLRYITKGNTGYRDYLWKHEEMANKLTREQQQQQQQQEGRFDDGDDWEQVGLQQRRRRRRFCSSSPKSKLQSRTRDEADIDGSCTKKEDGGLGDDKKNGIPHLRRSTNLSFLSSNYWTVSPSSSFEQDDDDDDDDGEIVQEEEEDATTTTNDGSSSSSSSSIMNRFLLFEGYHTVPSIVGLAAYCFAHITCFELLSNIHMATFWDTTRPHLVHAMTLLLGIGLLRCSGSLLNWIDREMYQKARIDMHRKLIVKNHVDARLMRWIRRRVLLRRAVELGGSYLCFVGVGYFLQSVAMPAVCDLRHGDVLLHELPSAKFGGVVTTAKTMLSAFAAVVEEDEEDEETWWECEVSSNQCCDTSSAAVTLEDVTVGLEEYDEEYLFDKLSIASFFGLFGAEDTPLTSTECEVAFSAVTAALSVGGLYGLGAGFWDD